ncbi:MAG: DMT family transporter [Solirubrobacterales bacterium]
MATHDHSMLKYPVMMALLAAALFGAATPAGKWLLAGLTPLQLAGLLYLGGGIGTALSAFREGGLRLPPRGDRRNRIRLWGAVIVGGVLGPIFLLYGLHLASAASVSLWLNLELAATAVLGVVFFRDHLGPGGWFGVVLSLTASALLSSAGGLAGLGAGGLVLLACICWGLDNHLTAVIDNMTPAQIAFWKGLVAGGVNLGVGLAMAPLNVGVPILLAALFVGACSYGASIVLYIASAQRLGATRAQIIFSTSPFIGVVLSATVLHERLSAGHLLSAVLFGGAISLLLMERHAHTHVHEALSHEHSHRHDDGHHGHVHAGLCAEFSHSHPHEHERTVHAHKHWPDLLHRHRHGPASGA